MSNTHPQQTDFTIRPAAPDDVPAILSLIRELAEYEKLSHEVVGTEADLTDSLFGNTPCAEALMGEHDGKPISYAIFFTTMSTFLCKPGIWLEDIYVQPEYRGHGYGKAMFLAVAEIAKQRHSGRLEWSALDWNKPAIDFYESMGAVAMDEWTIFRMTEDVLAQLPTND